MKRLLLLALVLIGTISMMAQTTYELTVAGTTVTSANCNDILGNGKVTYDAANKTLTLNSLVYASTKLAIESYIPDLKINVESNNILKTPIRLHANTTIEGTGTMIVQPSRGNAISFSGGALTIKDVKLGVPESSCAIYGDTDNSSCVLTVSNARMELNGSQEAIHVRALNLEGETGVMTENAIWSNSKYGYVDSTGTLITSLKLGTVYPLQVADKQVNEDNKDDILGNGKAVYDAANKILTLDSYANIDGETYSIKSDVDGLTINVDGRVSADKPLRLKGSTTIEGRGDFFIYSQALFGIWFSDGSLTVKGVRMIISGSTTGILGTMSDERCALYFKDNADVEITTKVADNTCAIKANALYFDDYLGIDSPGVVWSDTDHRTVDKDGNNAKEVSIGKASYPIWVAGTQVTKDNLHDILGDGTVSYNPSHHVLTFSGAKITAPSGTPVVKAEGELWGMRIEGTCSFEANDAVCFDLNTINGFTIEGGFMYITGSKDHAIFKAEYLTFMNTSIESYTGIFYDGGGNGMLNFDNARLHHKVLNADITSSIIGIKEMYIKPPYNFLPRPPFYNSEYSRYEIRDLEIIDNYQIQIGSTYIDCNNANDVLGDGTISFDYETCTLTLRNANCGPIASKIDDLTIVLEGDNKIEITRYGLGFEGNTKIIGKGGTMTLTEYLGNLGFAFIWFLSDKNITFENVNIVTNENCITPFLRAVGHVTMKNCNIKYNPAFNSNETPFSLNNPIEFIDCGFTYPANDDIEFNAEARTYYGFGCSMPFNFVISTKDNPWGDTGEYIKQYPLSIQGVRVTDANKDDILGNGNVTYDAENKVLNLSNTSVGEIKSQVSGLTIQVFGAVSVEGGISLFGPTTIQSHELAGSTLSLNWDISFSGGSLTIKNNLSLTIKDGRIRSNSKWPLIVQDKVTINIKENYCAIYNVSSIIFKDNLGIITDGLEWSEEKLALVDKDGNYATEVSIGKASYPIWVAGTQVTKDNLNDILGDGTVAYDTHSRMLTFSDANITAPSGTPVVKVEDDVWGIHIEGDCHFATDNAVCFDMKTIGGFAVEAEEWATMYVTGSKDHSIFKADYIAITNLALETLNGVFFDGKGKGRLKVQNSNVLHTVNNDNITSSIIGIEDLYIEEPFEFAFPDSPVFDSKNARYKVRDFGITNDYYLVHVNHIPISKYNTEDVLGDGTVSYDKVTQTLTMNNADIGDLSSRVDNLRISLIGDNRVSGYISTEQSINIVSDGGKSSFKLLSVHNLTLENVNAEIKATSDYGTPISVDGQLTLKNCNITYDPMTKDSKAFHLVNPIKFIGCEFTAPSSEYIKFDTDYYTYTAYGSTPIKYFEITPTKVYYWGDIDHNGILDMRDVVYMNRILMDRAVDAYGNADINHDTKIDTKDLNALVDIILGKREPEVLK